MSAEQTDRGDKGTGSGIWGVLVPSQGCHPQAELGSPEEHMGLRRRIWGYISIMLSLADRNPGTPWEHKQERSEISACPESCRILCLCQGLCPAAPHLGGVYLPQGLLRHNLTFFLKNHFSWLSAQYVEPSSATSTGWWLWAEMQGFYSHPCSPLHQHIPVPGSAPGGWLDQPGARSWVLSLVCAGC